MKSFKICQKALTLIFLLKIFSVIEAKEVSCENFNDFNWGYTVGTVKTCNMQTVTLINETRVNIAPRDSTVKGLLLDYNKKISYLPNNVAETFPNLKAYHAFACSLKVISKQNFNGLVKLTRLDLSGNQIENIENGTFDGLLNLEYLYLCK